MGVMAALVAVIVAEALIGDRAGAGVVSVSPPPGASPAVTASIQIIFSQPMDQPSVEQRLKLSPPVDGKFHWNGNTMLFTPSNPLAVGKRYSVTLSAGATSLLGRPLARELSWSFTPRPLSVLYLAPSLADHKGLWSVSLSGGSPRKLYAPPQGVDSFAVRPDGAQVALTVDETGQAADLWLLDPQTGDARQITRCAPDFCGRAAWSPDGARLAYERRSSGAADEGSATRIWLYDSASQASTQLFQDRSLPGFAPQWSPDGGHLAFYDPQAQSIDVVDLSSGVIAYLPSQDGSMGSFSPDGAHMVYEDFRSVGGSVFSELWLGNIGGDARISEMDANAQEDQFAAWSPDGQWIAFGRRRLDRQGGFGSQLYLFDTRTSQSRQLTDDPNFNSTAFAWSPSGDALLVQRFDLSAPNSGSSIWVYSMPGSQLTRIAPDGFGAAWLP